MDLNEFINFVTLQLTLDQMYVSIQAVDKSSTRKT
jgi:hypothetical protein